MCRALRVLCVAAGSERLSALKRAAVSSSWELVGGATSVEEAIRQLERRPDVIVLDSALGNEAEVVIRAAASSTRVVKVGRTGGEHEVPPGEEVKAAILAAPPVGGPVSGPRHS